MDWPGHVDPEEDGKYGKGKRGDELPEELARRGSRLARIREAKAALEREAQERAEEEKARVEAQLKEREKRERERGGSWAGGHRRRRTRSKRSRNRKRNEFYGPGFADHEGRSDERVCAGL